MKLQVPFYYHIILFLGLFFTFYLWDIGVNKMEISLIFNRVDFLFSVSGFMAIFAIYILNFYTFCNWFLSKKRVFLYLLSIPVSLVLFSGVRYFFQEIVLFEITGIHNYVEKSREIGFYIRDNFLFGLPAVIISTLAYLFWQFQEAEKQNQQLLLENKKSEFQLLKAQVSPHFLFNTLNSFYSDWVEKDAEVASDLLILSDLLRYVITETDKELVLLSREIQFLQNYIHLQGKRFENQLFLSFSVEGNYSNELILPSVLIHFVENVFKHGKLNDASKKALISINVKEGFLEISTLNYIVQGENYSSTGIGFENLTKRLEFAYNKKCVLEKNQENDTFRTYLRIPLKYKYEN
jgi:two-component system LytT family sensor kinase